MHKIVFFRQIYIVFLLGTVTLGGCATTATNPNDPYEGWNRGVQKFNDTLDKYAMKPVAQGYQWITPGFVDRGITNFFSNIDDIGVTLNDLLQFKLLQAGQDASRFLVNTTLGIAGFIDVPATVNELEEEHQYGLPMIDLPKHEEDFDQTLGVWGVPSGPYLVLPFLGPSSPRGVFGIIGDTAMNPITYIDNQIIQASLFVVKAVDFRADNLSASKIIDEQPDPYQFIRDAYRQRVNYLVNDCHLEENADLCEPSLDYEDE